MLWSLLMPKLVFRDISVSFDNVLDVAKASSGGQRDVNFLKFLVDSKTSCTGRSYSCQNDYRL